MSRDLGHTKGPCCNIFLPCTRNNLLSTTLTFSQMPGRGAHPLLPSPGEAFLHHLLNWPDYLKRPPEPLEIINSLTVLGIGLNNSTEKKKNLNMLLKKKKKKLIPNMSECGQSALKDFVTKKVKISQMQWR